MSEDTKTKEVQTNKTETREHPWRILSRIDVSSHIEKKNGLSYISWAAAWGLLKDQFPDAWFRKHETSAGIPYFIDVQGYAYVKVTVGLDLSGDYENTETFPVLDHRNKPIVGPSSFEVNNALQRCLAKCIAYHGLGHYIYAGEDLPSEANEAGIEAPHETKASSATKTSSSHQKGKSEAGIDIDDGTGKLTRAEGVKIVGELVLGLIVGASDEAALKAIYSRNKDAMDKIKAADAEAHAALMAAFKSRKSELTALNKGE